MAEAPVDITIRGARQLDSGARRLAVNIDRAATQHAAHPTAQQVAATVRARVPKDSGRLAASVQVRAGQVSIGAGLPYARWIEYGGSRGRPYRSGGRYLLPAARSATPAFRKQAEAACSQQIRSMHWPPPR